MYHKQTILRHILQCYAWPTNGVDFLSDSTMELYIHPATFALCCVLDPKLQHTILQNKISVCIRDWMPEGIIVDIDPINRVVWDLTDVSVMNAL